MSQNVLKFDTQSGIWVELFLRCQRRVKRTHCGIYFFYINCMFYQLLPHSPGVVYYHLLLRRETRIPGVAAFSFQIGFCDLFVHRGQISYTPTAFGKLWTTPGVRCMKHASS